MKINSYGWVFLFFIIVVVIAWIGGEAGFQTTGVPIMPGEVTYDQVLGVPTYHGALSFILNLSLANIEGMPWIFVAIFDFMPFMVAWITYRQIRGLD